MDILGHDDILFTGNIEPARKKEVEDLLHLTGLCRETKPICAE